MNMKFFPEGTKVTGTYYSKPFTGVVTLMRPHTIHPTMIKHYIALDAPIAVFGTVRTEVIVNTCTEVEINTLEAAA